MTGTHTQNPIYSRITMALMEDTGWYLPNYDMADNFKWGRNLSCSFALNSCLDWMETRHAKGLSIHPYCNKVKRDPLETECTDDRSSVALCNLVQHSNLLPPIFQVRSALYTIGYGKGKIILKYPPFCRLNEENQERENSKHQMKTITFFFHLTLNFPLLKFLVRNSKRR